MYSRGYKPIKFPEDESTHDRIVEWWYYNGHLKDADGNEYSFMDCLFKVDVKKVERSFWSRIPVDASYFSHSSVSDLTNRSFIQRISPFSLVSDDSFSRPLLYISYINPAIKNSDTNCIIEKIDESVYHLKNEDIDLALTSVKDPLLEGGSGFLDFHSRTTYYYSLTNLRTSGRIRINGKWIDVTGKSWMDHQWADEGHSLNKWDWFSVQFDDDTEMVCCVYDDGNIKTFFADISYPDSTQESYTEIEIMPLNRHWTSPRSKAVYPVSWSIKIPKKNIEIRLAAVIEDQEMLFGSINYWEGPLRVEGVFGEKKVIGVGFMELVGYPSEYSNITYLKDEIGKVLSWLILAIRKRAPARTAECDLK